MIDFGKRYPSGHSDNSNTAPAHLNQTKLTQPFGAHIQSFYHWFEKGKDTVTSVLAAEFSIGLLQQLTVFFTAAENETKPTEPLVHDLNETIKGFLKDNPGAVPILFSPDIPTSLRTTRDLATNAVFLVAASFLEKRGLGQRCYIVAQAVNSLLFFMQQLSVRLDKNGDAVFDPDVEEELERMLVRYLKPYFEQ